MAPTLARAPFHRDGWVVEEKVDGWRIVAWKNGPRVRLISRNHVDHTRRFPELAATVAKLRPDVLVLDGEVAVFDDQLVSRIGLLGEPDPAVLCTPPMLIAFDILQVGRHDVRRWPLRQRRAVLEEAITGSEMVLPVRRLESHGEAAWQTVQRRGLEGFVAKDPKSTYRQGLTRSWVKVKLRHEGVFVVGGIRDVDAFDGDLVGEWVGEQLQYRGVVEWGFQAADVLELLRGAKGRRPRMSPFADLRSLRGAVWLEPRLSAEISYAEILAGRLRAPVWRRLMPRKHPPVNEGTGICWPMRALRRQGAPPPPPTHHETDYRGAF
jgi:bifunctional non-homologous end joining protein LigD